MLRTSVHAACESLAVGGQCKSPVWQGARSAVPLLEDALPRLESSRDHQRIPAHALAHLKGDEPLTGWATSDHPALRLVAAERLLPTVGGGLNPLLGQLTHDPAEPSLSPLVRNVADARTTEGAEQLKIVASAPP